MFVCLSTKIFRYIAALSLSTVLACVPLNSGESTTIIIKSANGARIKIKAGPQASVTINADSAAIINAGPGSEVIVDAGIGNQENETPAYQESRVEPSYSSLPYAAEEATTSASGNYPQSANNENFSVPTSSSPYYGNNAAIPPVYSSNFDSENPSEPIAESYGAQKNISVRPYIEYAAGKEIGVDQSYSTLGVYSSVGTHVSSGNSRLWLYNDSSWHHLIRGSNAGSIEAGFIWGNQETSYGGYIAYDTRKWHKNTFDQVSGGFQLICCPWQFLFNVSVPTKNEQTRCSTQFLYEGGYKASFRNFDATYRMISATIGRNFCTGIDNLNVAAAVEPYYLKSDSRHLHHHNKSAWGTRGTILTDWSPFNLEASVSYDRIFHTRGQVVVGLDLVEAYNRYSNRCGCIEGCGLYKTFRRQQFVPIKGQECWKYNWNIPCDCEGGSGSPVSSRSGSGSLTNGVDSYELNVASNSSRAVIN